MTTNVFTFDEEDDLADICQCLINNSFRRVPVLHQGRLAAIITRADLIRANKDKFRPQTAQDNSMPDAGNPVAKDVMKSGLLTVGKSTPVYEAMEILATKNITGLPVVDDYMNLVGVVSEKDILKLLYDPKAKPGLVQDYMTRDVVGFDQNASLFEICHCLVDNNFRRVPILDNSKLVGIISRTDIMAYIMKNRSRFFSQKPKS
jgi:CBS domain-containing protein